jgi:hypothetical protein
LAHTTTTSTFAKNSTAHATTLAVTEKRYTVEEWLELEKTAELRHEYYFGKLIHRAGKA